MTLYIFYQYTGRLFYLEGLKTLLNIVYCRKILSIKLINVVFSEAAQTNDVDMPPRQRRHGHSGPPTGDFQLSNNSEHGNDDEEDNDVALMRASQRIRRPQPRWGSRLVTFLNIIMNRSFCSQIHTSIQLSLTN